MRSMSLVLIVIVLQAGCTAQALRRRTVAQTQTWMDVQYRQVMENLAMMANNPDVLPCFSTIDFGTTDVSDTFNFVGVLNIPPKGTATTGSLDPSVKRQVKENWTLTQVTGPEKLRALRLAFQYAISGDENLLVVHDHHISLDSFSYQLDHNCRVLTQPKPQGPCPQGYQGEPGYYFGVQSDLKAMQHGWVHVGSKKKVPKCARFVACCCDTYVWVNEEDMNQLSQFTLVIQRIARQVVEAAYYPPPDNVTITFSQPAESVSAAPKVSQLPAPNNSNQPQGSTTPSQTSTPQATPPQPAATACDTCTSNKNMPLLITNSCTPRDRLYIGSIALPVNCYGQIVVRKVRGDAITTSDTKLKSAVSAAIKGP